MKHCTEHLSRAASLEENETMELSYFTVGVWRGRNEIHISSAGFKWIHRLIKES
uniref:Uncharacterized protein n=1 Tax=Manihot esculenta TaxID=3983 RepID=A0A2C9WJ57_MANES